MKHTIHTLALFLALQPAIASAQQFPSVPAQSVIGRLGIPGDNGPSQAIPFSALVQIMAQQGLTRIALKSPLKLYVNPSSTAAASCNGATGGIGSDSNAGSLAAPFLTPTKALNVALSNYDVRLSQITIQYCDNSVTGAVYPVFNMTANLVGAISGGNASSAQLIIQGNSTTPANVLVQGAGGASAFAFVGVTSPVIISNLQCGATTSLAATSGHCIQSDAHSMVYYSNVTFGFISTGWSHMVATYGSFIEQEGVERIIGGASLHWFADRVSQILTTGNTITCTGTPAFPSSFVGITNGSVFTLSGAAFSGCGGVTGTKYIADNTSSFGSGTADPNSIYPGNANGAVTLPSYNQTGIWSANGGPPTGIAQSTAVLGTANYLPKWAASSPFLTSTSLLFDSGTQIGINNPVPGALIDGISPSLMTLLHLTQGVTGNAPVLIDAFGGIALFQGRASSGTFASPTLLTNGSHISDLLGFGYDGAGYNGTADASVSLRAAANFSTSSHPTRVVLSTTPSGSKIAVDRWSVETDGSLLGVNIAAPSTPSAGNETVWTDTTDKRLHDKNDAGTIGTTVVADTGAASNFLTAISAAGVIGKARPVCADLSNSGTACQQGYTATTWTPAVTASVTAGTPAYSFQVGSYEQIGRQVTVRFSIGLSGWTGTPSGNASITGLPIASANTTNDYGSCIFTNYSVSALVASAAGMTGYIAPGTSTIVILANGNSASNAVTATQLGTTPSLYGQCSYHT